MSKIEDILKIFENKKWKVRKDDRGFIYLKKYHREIIISIYDLKYWCNSNDGEDNYINYAEHCLIGKILSIYDRFGRRANNNEEH